MQCVRQYRCGTNMTRTSVPVWYKHTAYAVPEDCVQYKSRKRARGFRRQKREDRTCRSKRVGREIGGQVRGRGPVRHVRWRRVACACSGSRSTPVKHHVSIQLQACFARGQSRATSIATGLFCTRSVPR
eukprot:1252900-Rhodomonas_salina.1